MSQKPLKERLPLIDEEVIKELDKLYPPMEYSNMSTREEWAVRGGQRDVINKLKSVRRQQIGRQPIRKKG